MILATPSRQSGLNMAPLLIDPTKAVLAAPIFGSSEGKYSFSPFTENCERVYICGIELPTWHQAEII